MPILIVAGPTASGKSAAALRLAKAVGGEIVCADSMQVYGDLQVVTARPSARDERQVPHHLYGHVDGRDRYSAGRFASEAKTVIAAIRARGGVPILCGGTGLYLKSATDGLSPIPAVPEDVSSALASSWEKDPERFRAELVKSDPAMERLAPADRQRHIRARAVLEATGKPLSEWQRLPLEPLTEGPVYPALLLPDRETLYARCDARFEAMLAAGAEAEVEALLARDLPSDLPVMKALGVPELAALIDGRLSRAEATALAQQETRRFAKRQMTWFRNQTDWPRFESAANLIEHLAAISRKTG